METGRNGRHTTLKGIATGEITFIQLSLTSSQIHTACAYRAQDQPSSCAEESEIRTAGCQQLRGTLPPKQGGSHTASKISGSPGQALSCTPSTRSEGPRGQLEGEHAGQTFNTRSWCARRQRVSPPDWLGLVNIWGPDCHPGTRVMPESQPYTRSLSHTPEQRAKTKETRPTAERPQDQLNHLKNRAKHSSEDNNRTQSFHRLIHNGEQPIKKQEKK